MNFVACLRRTLLALALTALFAPAAHAQAGGAQQGNDSPQATTGAEQVMRTLADGLTGNSARNFLAAFAADRFPDYDNFADQARMFFSTYDSFRVHYQIVEVLPVSDTRASMTANMEMEADSATGGGPGLGRNGQLQLTIESGKNGWKITDMRPREFFR